jgi:hypothetical protein
LLAQAVERSGGGGQLQKFRSAGSARVA